MKKDWSNRIVMLTIFAAITFVSGCHKKVASTPAVPRPPQPAPVAPVVSEPASHAVIDLESKTSEARRVDTENPDPETVKVAPTGPFGRFTAIFGVVTVNLPVATFPSSSVAFTAVPDAPVGTPNVQLNVPRVPDVREPCVQLEIVLLSKVSDFSFAETENPAPETVTTAPNGPWVGVTVIAGTGEKTMSSIRALPFVVTDPDAGVTSKPTTDPREKE